MDQRNKNVIRYITRQKDLAVEDALKHVAKYGNEIVSCNNNPFVSDADKEKWLNWWKSLLANYKTQTQHNAPVQDLLEFEEKALGKWYGPQGFTPSAEIVEELINKYYQDIPQFVQPELSEDVLVSLWSQITNNGTVDVTKYVIDKDLWLLHNPDHKSNSGLTSWSDRRIKSTKIKAVKQAYYSNEFDPVVIGTRHQRNKFRTIFMDSYANYFREAKVYGYFMHIMKHSDSVAWRGDRFVEKSVQDFLRSHNDVFFFESDYEAMDTWVTKEHALFTFTIFKELDRNFDIPWESIEEVTNSIFNMPLITPNGLRTGKHSLFSGIYPTNPLESPLNLIIMTDWICEINKMIGKDNDFKLIVLGDDVLLVMENWNDYAALDLPEHFASWVWNKYRIKANPSKQRVSRSSGFFCKRQYRDRCVTVTYPEFGRVQIQKSIYPLTLVLNSILNPEKSTQAQSKAQSLIQIFQKCDNAYGHPLYKPFMQYLFTKLKDLAKIDITEVDVQLYNETHDNWRLRLYGETFSLPDSPSYNLWMQYLVK